MTDKKYYQLPPQDVDKYWGLFGPLIDKALQRVDDSDYTIFGIYHRVKIGQWQLFFVLDGEEVNSVFVSCVVPFDTCNYLNVCVTSAANGKKIDYAYMLECYKEIARAYNCSKISAMGRKGWKKIMPKFGCEEKSLFIKEVD